LALCASDAQDKWLIAWNGYLNLYAIVDLDVSAHLYDLRELYRLAGVPCPSDEPSPPREHHQGDWWRPTNPNQVQTWSGTVPDPSAAFRPGKRVTTNYRV
jgi:hypothetical protein